MKNSKNIIITVLAMAVIALVIIIIVGKQKQGSLAANVYTTEPTGTLAKSGTMTVLPGWYFYQGGVCWHQGGLGSPVTPTPYTLAGCPGAHINRPGNVLITKTGELVTGTVTYTDVQQRLQTFGFYSGKTTGSLDTPTMAAIKGYQKTLGLPVTGSLEASTLKSIFELDVTVKQ